MDLTSAFTLERCAQASLPVYFHLGHSGIRFHV